MVPYQVPSKPAVCAKAVANHRDTETHIRVTPAYLRVSVVDVIGLLPDKILPLIDGAGNSNIEEAHHHLFMALVAPPDGRVRVWIVRVVPRVVIPRDGLDPRAGFKRTRLGEPIAV